jgi:hypothetical protein
VDAQSKMVLIFFLQNLKNSNFENIHKCSDFQFYYFRPSIARGDINSKNPKTLSLRKLLDEEREKVTLLWVPGHMGIPGNETSVHEPRSLCDGNQFEETRNPESGVYIMEYQEQTTSLVSSFYHSKYRI